jgi:threonine/homoserine/homoserine lactone efflux protein
MELLWVFAVGLVFSFIGSIPPGTLNLCVLQLGLERKVATALRFALAVSIVEYPYTWIGIQFEYWITNNPLVIENFRLIAAVVMILLGALNLWSARKPTAFARRFEESGFRRGFVLSLLNPLAIPYWIGVTAYLKSQGWIDLSSVWLLHSYIFGTAVGAMLLLTVFAFMAQRVSRYVSGAWAKLVPGFVLLALGLYALAQYLFL